jgi:RNA ligase (TIGR02306 family)
MPSDLIVPVVEITTIRPHKNADKLEIIDLFNGQYQTVTEKGLFKPGDKAIYFPVDCLIGEDLIAKYSLTSYLVGPAKDRVKCVRLRGEESFGLLIKDDDFTSKHKDNVADVLNVKKYEPPVRAYAYNGHRQPKTFLEKVKIWATRDGIVFKPDLDFIKYTDIHNGRFFTDVFAPDEKVVITEKIHGANARYANLSGKTVLGSHSVQRPAVYVPENFLTIKIKSVICKIAGWTRGKSFIDETLWHKLLKCEYMKNFLAWERDVILFGEIYGSSVQNLAYGIPVGEVGFRAFDLYSVNLKKYLGYSSFKRICEQYLIPTVPELYVGKFKDIDLKTFTEGKSTLANHIREGVVIKPLIEDTHPKIGRKILKYISSEYLLAKKEGDDSTDV